MNVPTTEYQALKYLAEVEEKPISTLMKEIALEKAENDYYYHLAEQALHEHEKDQRTYTLDQVIKHLRN